jgi:hypothetical protein
MKTALYVARFPGEGFDDEVAAARAFCAQHGLAPVRLYHSDFLQDRRKLAAFLEAARAGAFEVVVGPFPDCFSTRLLGQLVSAGVGFACYHQPGPRAS